MSDDLRKDRLCEIYEDIFDVKENSIIENQSEFRYQKIEKIEDKYDKVLYQAFDEKMNRLVTLEKFKESGTEEERQNFILKSKILASLQHPNILPVYDMYTFEKEYWVSTKKVKGRSLKECVLNGSLELNSSLAIFNKVCDAIEFAHSKGVLHTKLALENIWVNSYSDVLVCGWEAISLLQHNDIKISHEVKALGELLSNLIRDGKNSAVEIPLSLEAICSKAINPKKQDFYGSVQELQNDLDAYLSGYPTSVEKNNYLRMMELFYSRNRSLCHSGLGIVLMVLCLSSYYAYSLSKKEKIARIALNSAEENLQQYLKEKSIKETLNDLGADFFINIAKERMLGNHFDSAYTFLLKLPNIHFSGKQLSELNSIMGKLAFQTQDFKKAIELIQGNNSYEENMLELARKYSPKKNDGELLLHGKDLKEFILDLQSFDEVLVRDLYHFMKKKYTSLEDFVHVVEAVMLFMNKNISKVHIKLDKINEKYYLDVSNNPDVAFIPGLPFMKLYSLNLSNSGIGKNKLIWISKMDSLVELDLSFCDINDYSFLSECKSLRKITVDQHQAQETSFLSHSAQLEVVLR